jgi:hypothetical protein
MLLTTKSQARLSRNQKEKTFTAEARSAQRVRRVRSAHRFARWCAKRTLRKKTETPSFILPRILRLCRNQENCINVILSAAKNLTFPPLTRARSFGYRLRMTLRHSLFCGGGKRWGSMPFEEFARWRNFNSIVVRKFEKFWPVRPQEMLTTFQNRVEDDSIFIFVRVSSNRTPGI